MKKLHIFALCLAAFAIGFSSCSKGGSSAEKEEEAKYEVTAADSAAILASTDRIMTLFQDEKIDDAAALLQAFVRSDSTLRPLSDEEIQMLRNRQTIFPVKGFAVQSTDYVDPYNNTVVYDVFFSVDSLGQPNPDMRTKMAFNLIHQNGTYVPTLKDK